MAEHQVMNVGLGDMHMFAYECGHKFNQLQPCPACESLRMHKHITARVEHLCGKIDERDGLLVRCKDVFLGLCEKDNIEPEVKHDVHKLAMEVDNLLKSRPKQC